MVFNDIKPKTKRELVLMQQLLASTKTLESARIAFPEKLLLAVTQEMNATKQNFETVIKDIKLYLNNMKSIKVYIAFEPTMKLLDRMYHAFGIDQTERYLEILRDESLVGGVKVVIDGKQYDQTIDKVIYEKCI